MGWGSRAEKASAVEEREEFQAFVSIRIVKVRKTVRAVGGQLQPVAVTPASQVFEAGAEGDTATKALTAALAEVERTVAQGLGGSALKEALSDE